MKRNLSVFIAFLIIIVVFYYRIFIQTYMHGDFIAYWVPNFKYILDSLREGYIPWWQPYSYLGLPEVFKLELALFYPFTWLILVVNLVFNPTNNLTFLGKSLEVMQYVNFFVGASGMYLMLRKIFKTSEVAAFSGSLVFIFSFYITIQSGDISSLPGKLLLPWIVLFLINFIKSKTPLNYSLLVVINYMVFALGYPYNYVYFFIFQVGIAIFYGWKNVLQSGLAYVNALLISSYFLLPNFHILSQSFRGVTPAGEDPFFHLRSAFTPTKLVNVFNPQIFSNLYDMKDPNLLFSMGTLSWGMFPLIFLIIGFSSAVYHKKHPWIYITLFLGILVSLGAYLDVPRLIGTVFPPLEKFRSHSQVLSLTFFTGVIILSGGIDSVTSGNYSKKVMYLLWELALGMSVLLLILPYVCLRCSAGATDISVSYARTFMLFAIGLVLVHIIKQSKKSIYIYLGIFITILEFSFYSQNIPFLRMPTSYGDYYKSNSLIVERPSDNNLFRYSFTENQFIYNTSMLGIYNLQGYETIPYKAFYLLNRYDLQTMLQFTNTKYLVTNVPDKDKEFSGLKLVKKVDPSKLPNETYYGTVEGRAYFSPHKSFAYYIYQVQNYYPRYYIPEKAATCDSTACYLVDPSKITYTLDKGIDVINPAKDKVNLNVVEFKPNSITLKVNSPEQVFIASSEVWDKGWSLEIDRKKQAILNASDGFRAFIVPKGSHTITMTYFPPLFKEGIIITCGGAILFLLAIKSMRKATS